MSISVGFMVGVWLVFGLVVGPIFRASIPVVKELVLGGTATEPPEVHIHHLAPERNNYCISNTYGG
jgi:hypothetical protein